MRLRSTFLTMTSAAAAAAMLMMAQKPQALPDGYALPNGWRITPVGKAIPTEDMILNVSAAPDGKAVVALHGGFNPHGLVVVNPATDEAIQRIPLKTAWLGLAWTPDGKGLYVSGGNAAGARKPTAAPIYKFGYAGGKLTAEAAGDLNETLPMDQIYWSGLAHHPKKPVLYAANKGTGPAPGYVAVFDTGSMKLTRRIPVEISPYDVVITPDGATVYVSNWGSDSISVIDTASEKVVATIAVGDNPNDLELIADGRLFVSCASDNTVVVVDTKKGRATERITVSLHPRAPEGTTPNALIHDAAQKLLFVANADNNAIAVVNVDDPGESDVLGFLPSGWYPSALAIANKKLFIGNSKGLGGYANIRGPHSPLPDGPEGKGSVKSLQKGTIGIVPLAAAKAKLREWTRQVYANAPYNDELLARAKAPAAASAPSVVPREVGAGSPIKHVIYIIKENRTYDQVLGDLPKGDGDPRLTIFGRTITPNQHRLAETFVQFDNLYCDGEVSVDGHSWSNSAIATDFNEKFWPPNYGQHSRATASIATVPAGGHLWDLAKRKGLTYRSYGEYASRVSDGTTMDASPGAVNLYGHVSPRFKLPGMRDTDNVKEFIREFDEYEANFASTDANKRLPNFIVMSLPENHTAGTAPGRHTPRAMVANNDYAVGMLVERVTHSKYWPETALFIIEDDAQDGSDHVDARRTTGFVVSPYTKRGVLDSTLYTTSSMLRTMELLLGLPPMTQYDAAANPMYAAFSDKSDLTPYKHVKPDYDLDEKNTVRAWGARQSEEMDFSDVDRAPMFALNEIIWKSVRGADSEMPLPVHRYWFRGQTQARAAAVRR